MYNFYHVIIMKKLLSLLMAAMLLPLTSGAVDLAPNQMLMGHYLTDDLATSGWGYSDLQGLNTVATDFTPEQLALYQGGEIVAFRVGLHEATPVSRLFIIPIDPYGNLLWGNIAEWPCEVSAEVGWNMIELETPYKIEVPDGYSLRIGFDYEQIERASRPLSVVRVGVTCPTYHYMGDGEWRARILSSKGNLSMQLVVENDNFPKYPIWVRNITLPEFTQTGNDIPYTFETSNLGQIEIGAGNCTYEVAVDGEVIATMTNPQALTSNYLAMSGVIHTADLSAGVHTLTITPVMANGETIENPRSFPATFKTYDNGFERQMRLVEQFTSTECTWCPLGSASLTVLSEMRGDIAWVGVHQILSSYDPFQNSQCDTIAAYQGGNSFPTGSFDRYAGIESANSVLTGLAYDDSNYGASVYDSFLNYVAQSPSWATVNINSTYDAATRKAIVTVNGDLVANYEDFMGPDSKLTVYITEDGLIAQQIDQGTLVPNYVHNGVLRMALGSAMGVALKKTGNGYKNEFTVNIPNTWNADNLNIVAFVSRPLGGPVNDIYVTNANKRKLGESDEPAFVIGDVDGDGEVTIADVARLVDYLLTDGATSGNAEAADCDNDGIVTISDVTLLIDYLLKGTW